MKRLTDYAFNESISYAFSCLPDYISDALRDTHFFCGADPIFAGLHKYRTLSDDRSLREWAHITWGPYLSVPKSEKISTIVLPKLVEPLVVIHELGHALHEKIRFNLVPKPVTWYATTDKYEAFAEWFTSYYGFYGKEKMELALEDREAVYKYQQWESGNVLLSP